MSSTITKTMKVKMNSMLVTKFCDENLIPYFYCRITLKNGEKDIKGCPVGYMKMTYEEAMEHNKSVPDTMKTHVNIILKSSDAVDKYMVVDLDDKADQEIFTATFGMNYKTKSSRKGLPHLWFLKKQNDYSKNAQKIEINGVKTQIDLCYNNIYEKADSKMEYMGDITDIKEFDFETYHPEPINELPVPRQPKEPSKEYTGILKLYFCKRVIHQLNNIDPTLYIAVYKHWYKVGNGIKSTFAPLEDDTWFEVLVRWSELSSDIKHKCDDTDKWRKIFEPDPVCGLNTIMEYSRNSNLARYEEIEKQYQEDRKADLDAERKVLLTEGKRLLMNSIREYDEEQQKKKEEFPTYEMVKEEFEKKYCLIKQMSVYLETLENSCKYYSGPAFTLSHKMIKYYEHDKDGNLVEKKFIAKWTEDPTMRMYDYCDYYPPPLTSKCPPEVYNLWRPFAVEKLRAEYPDYVKNNKALEMFIHHIAILCNHQKEVVDYILLWIGQMLKFPGIKTIVPTFISKQGSGKGTLLDWLRLIMGDRKVLASDCPSEDIWGSFNGLVKDAFLINLDELSKKETKDAEGRIKRLTTEVDTRLNSKGVDQYMTKFYGRFIITTQDEEPIISKEDDRRNLIIRTSNEKCKSKNPNVVNEYFKPLRQEIESIEGQLTIYDFLINQEGLEDFINLPIPETEFQNEMKYANRSYYEHWLDEYSKDFPRDKLDINDCIELTSRELLEAFTSYLTQNKILYSTSVIKLGKEVSNLCGEVKGLKKKSPRGGSPFVLNIKQMREHYGPKCKIDCSIFNE